MYPIQLHQFVDPLDGHFLFEIVKHQENFKALEKVEKYNGNMKTM